MAHKLVKYRLTKTGRIPSFVLHGDPNSVQGFSFHKDDVLPHPQDGIMLAITVDNPSRSTWEEIGSYSELYNYLDSIKGNIKQMAHDRTQGTFTLVDYDAAIDAQWVWNRLQALNA